MLITGVSNSQLTGLPRADLKTALNITVNQTYSFSQPMMGHGDIKEFRVNSTRSSNLFKEERNSAWFIINIPYQGLLTFDLIPHDPNNDYDWMLFNSSADLEKLIKTDQAKPLRSNNARNNKSNLSMTGLNIGSKSALIRPGPGNNYSAPLQVKPGLKLYLVVDNIYGGKGFNLNIKLNRNFQGKTVLLSGIVKDKSTLKNLSAEILIEDDSTGLFIGKVKSDSLSGKYQIQVPAGRSLNATAFKSNYLFLSNEVNVSRDTIVNFELDTLAIGKKLVLFNIHFLPNKDQILPSSNPELERLLKLLNERPKLAIKIVGHTNNNVFASPKYLQQLSFDRAIAVKKYLTDRSISAKRISCLGLGGKEPLIDTRNPQLGLKNLRVEVWL